jgi:pimeloyl-ACP methyl ester carboxylesterase
VRASLFDDVSGLLAEWPSEQAQEGIRTVVLVGSAPPDDTLHTAVERVGWTVAEELYDRSMYRLGASVDPAAADPVSSVALGWLEQPPQSIALRLRDRKIDAAVLWSMREDESLAWRVPAQRAALEAEGIPTLVLTARSWNVDDGAVEETQSFLRGLR